MHSKVRSTFMTMMLGVSLAGGPAMAEAPREPATESLRASTGALEWTEVLGTGEGTGELVRTSEGLVYEPYNVMRRREGLRTLTGLYTFPARRLERPVDTVGTWSFPAGWNKVQLSRWTTSGYYVVADAIQVR